MTGGTRLAELAEDPVRPVRVAVAGNWRTPADVLVQLLDDPDHSVSWYASSNPRTPARRLDAWRARNAPSTAEAVVTAQPPDVPVEPRARLVPGTPIAALITGVQRSFQVDGRSTRPEFFWFVVLVTSLQMTLLVAALVLESFTLAVLVVVLGVLACIPLVTVSVRRLHDTGRSGVLLLWGLAPFIGAIVVVLLVLQTSDEDNRWGPSPYSPD